MTTEQFSVSISGPGLKIERQVGTRIAEQIIKMLMSGSELGWADTPDRKAVLAKKARTRGRGRYQMTIFGADYNKPNIRETLKNALLVLSNKDSSFLDRLSQHVVKNRRVVARYPQDLYINSPHLAKNFAFELTDEWYFDGNLSLSQLQLRLELACEVAGIRYGQDLIPPKDQFSGLEGLD